MMNLSRYIFTVCSLVISLQLVAQNSDRDCIRMGNKYFRDKEFNKAETYYRKALEMNPSLEAYYNLGNAVAFQGNDSVAFEQYKKALEQMAETPEKKAWVYHNMGNMTYLNGRSLMKANSPDAMKSFQQAVELYALQHPVVLGKPLLLELFDNLVGRQVTPLSVILCLAQFDHAQQVALDMTACNESDEVRIGKPAVNEQIVEADTASDGILHHLDGLVGLLHRVLPDALLDSLSTMVLSETSLPLLVRQSLFPAWFPSFLAMKGEVEHQLAQTIGIKQSQALVAKDSLMLNMGEHLADELTLASALGSIRVIDNQTDSPVILSLAATADLPQQLEVHRVEQLAPLNVTIIHKTIEHVLLTTEQAA